MSTRVSVCVLLYGDYPHLAKRCLTSILRSAQWEHIADVRIGLNVVSAATDAFVSEALEEFARHTTVVVYRPDRNAGKYTLMRRMFYDKGFDPADHIMWFDDDSYVTAVDPSFRWWSETLLAAETADVMGDVWFLTYGFKRSQLPGIVAQPWYAGKLIPRTAHPSFVTGGWWTARTSFLKKWDYPFKEINHSGGDTILGELVRQQGAKLKRYKQGVIVNNAERRGSTTPWPFENYRPGVLPDLSHHDYDCRTTHRVVLNRKMTDGPGET